MTEGKIVSWVKAPGDKVERGETGVIVEADKADMGVESFQVGFLATIIVADGEVAPVGSAIALLAETEAEIEQAVKQAEAGAAGSPEPAAVPTEPVPVAAPAASQNGASNESSGRVIISPRARKLAKSLKVDLATSVGSGPHGRIVAQDVEVAAGKTPTPSAPPVVPTVAPPAPAVAASPAPAAPAPVSATVPLGQMVPFNTLQQAVVRNMVASLQVPTFHVGYTITTDALDALYKQLKPKGVTMTGLLAKAVAVTLQKHPLVNASYRDGGIQYSAGINVAVAVAMEGGGLITPVLQGADQMDIYSLSRTWKDLVKRSRSKQLHPEEYSSGTFTLSNLGMFGVSQFDAILPPGQGSILAISAAKPTVVATADGMMGVRKQMQVNIPCDHRIIYGADAAGFLKDLADLIENNPQSLTL